MSDTWILLTIMFVAIAFMLVFAVWAAVEENGIAFAIAIALAFVVFGTGIAALFTSDTNNSNSYIRACHAAGGAPFRTFSTENFRCIADGHYVHVPGE